MKKNKTTFLGGLILMVCCLAVVGLSYAQNGQWGRWCYKDYSYTGSAQTFTVPANCTKVTVEAIGGGGAGGYAYKGRYAFPIDYYRVGGGGGGAAYARTENQTVSAGDALTINVGQGGRNSGDGAATTVYKGSTRWLEAAGGKHGQWSRSGTDGGNLHAAGGAGGSENDSYYIGTGTKKAGGNGGKAKDFDTGLSANQVGSGSGGGAAGGTGSGSNGADQAGGNDWAISSEGGNGGGGNNSGLISGATWVKGGKGANGRYWQNDWGAGFDGNTPGAGGSGGRADENHGPYNGGNGGDGFVRVWFYIESSTPLTLTVGTTSTGCPYTLTANATNELFTKNYKWSTGATNTSIEVSPGANTTYTVTVTDVFSGATSACQIQSINSIAVNACSSECSVSLASAAASPSEICEGGSTTLSASVASPDGSATYAWTVNGTAAGTGTSLSYPVTPSGTTTYTIVVTVTKGSYTATDTRDVDVTVDTKVDPTFASLKDKYCAGTVPAASSLPTTSDNGIEGNWSVSTSGSTATFTFTPGTDECANTFTQTATISANPTGGVIEPNIVVCDGSTTYTFVNSTSAAGGVNGGYRWQVSLNGITGWFTLPLASANTESYAPMADMTSIASELGLGTPTGTFYFRRAWVNDCEIVYSNILSLDNPGTLAAGSITVTGDAAGAYCADKNVSATLTANPTATLTGATFSYQWQQKTTGDWTDISGATNSTYAVSLSPVQQISYRYKVKYSTCDWMTSNNTYDLTVKPVPVVKINGENPYNVSKCADASIDVTVTGAASYEWENHSTANPATFGPSTTASSYVVTGTTDGCSSTATVTFTILPVPTITATPANQSITYGQYITDVVITNTASTVSLSPATLPGGLTYSSSTISGKPTAQGSYTITATANSTYGCTPATQEIKINVGKKNLTVTYTGTDGDNTKVYDGYPLTLSYDKLTFTGLESTDHITSGVITTDGYKVGDYICNAGSFGRMWATGTATPSGFGPASVTQNYTVTFNVTLSITKRSLEITANSASKEYDATPLTPPAPGYSFTNGTSLATTDEATIAVSGSQLCPGSSNSTVTTVVITHTDDNVDVTDCYNITKKTGTLTVTPMACPATKTFEGYDYPLVQVGNKCWFAENLRAAATDAVPYDNQSANTAKFGLLYNWSAALAGNGAIKTDPCNGEFVQGICPSGWAIPSAADFNELQSIASGVINLRSDDATYWLPEYLGTDAVNFDERGGGLFNATLNRFEELKTAAYFWTSESVLHAASFPDGVAHTYCDEYYCGEYIPKTISVNSKSSIRCVRKTKED